MTCGQPRNSPAKRPFARRRTPIRPGDEGAASPARGRVTHAEREISLAGAVKGGIAWGGPTEVAAKVNQNLKEFSSLKYYK